MTAAYDPSTAAASTTAGPAGGPTQSPTASGLVNAPVNSLAPVNTPAAWGLTTQLLNAPLYVGSKTQSVKVSSLKTNQLLGQVADKLGIKAKKGQSLEEQVIDTLAQRYNIPKAGKSDASLLSAVMTNLGVNTANPKNKMALSTSLTDPNVLGQVADKLGVAVGGLVNTQTSPTTTLGKAAMQIYGMNSKQIASLQAKLWEGGFYDEDVEGEGGVAGPDAKKITPGNLDPYTMKAFGQLLSQTADSGKKISWTDALDEASGTNSLGLQPGEKTAPTIEQLLGADDSTSSSTPKVTLATPDQMMSTLQSYFEEKLGRMPTQAELNQFTSQYDSAQTAASKELDPNTFLIPDSTTGVDEEPGVPTSASAATEFAQSDGTEYMAHQVANAGALMLNAMRENGGLGANPNLTTAG